MSAGFSDSFIRAVRSETSSDGLGKLMHAVAQELGFQYFALIHHVDLLGSAHGWVDIKHYPEEAVARILGAGFRRDPVLRACAFADSAFSWSEIGRLIELDRRDRVHLELGLRQGLNAGVTVPSGVLGDRMGSCTFAGTRRPDRINRLLGPIEVIGTFAFQAARRISARVRPLAPRLRLHPRVRDCVILAGQGHTNKEIARFLGVTPRTVDGYLTNARQIFDAHDRTEMVMSAIFAGEIDLSELKRRQPE